MRLIFAFAAALATSAAAQPPEPGNLAHPVGLFTTIVNESPADVLVQIGGVPTVRKEGDPAALAALDTYVDRDRLVVRTRPGTRWPRGRARAIVYVTTPSLGSAVVSGSGNIRVDKVSGATFNGSAHGSGNLTIDDLRTQAASLSSHGSGNVAAIGAVQRLEVFSSGSGNVDAARVQARTVRARTTGSGNVDALAADGAEVVATGSGRATVLGTTSCRVRSTGSGGVRCG